jgi:hypothetical protein
MIWLVNITVSKLSTSEIRITGLLNKINLEIKSHNISSYLERKFHSILIMRDIRVSMALRLMARLKLSREILLIT